MNMSMYTDFLSSSDKSLIDVSTTLSGLTHIKVCDNRGGSEMISKHWSLCTWNSYTVRFL